MLQLEHIPDPVCGSVHCALAPYWSQKLGKCDFVAYSASPRSGKLKIHLVSRIIECFYKEKAVMAMEGSILV
ncbi:hypothetical protein PTKIN_Ptkin12aG0121700 [Pterospermum kingtungense]